MHAASPCVSINPLPPLRYRVFVWGIFFFCASFACLCYFWCCAVPPGYRDGFGAVGGNYAVHGHMVVAGPGGGGGQPMYMVSETQPLFQQQPGGGVLQYSSGNVAMYTTAAGGVPMPPPYQFAYQYPGVSTVGPWIIWAA